ncbi:MAG: C10 family peptidase [bacterium]
MKRVYTIANILTIIAVSGLCLIPCSASGTTATALEARQVAANWLQYSAAKGETWKGQVAAQIGVTDMLLGDSGELLAWCFQVDPVGYIMVPLLKELPAIKMYSSACHIDVSDSGGPAQLLREVLSARHETYRTLHGSLDQVPTDPDQYASSTRTWEWLAVSSDRFVRGLTDKGATTRLEAGPLLTSYWDQGPPYNAFCPTGDGGLCVVGCVATSFAQIMAYHQWPLEGEGSHTYYWNGDQSCDGSSPGQNLTADFSDPYDWNNIVDNCYFGCEPETVLAIAELCYEVGVALHMNYGVCASGAWPSRMLTMMPQHFGYKPIMSEIHRSDYSLTGWYAQIQQQIDQGLPAEYTIYSHSIVCDGYRMDGDLRQYHMNYGWANGNNSWYTLDSLHCPWDGCDPMIEGMIIDMKPDRDLVMQFGNTIGFEPLPVQFTGYSELEVESWQWSFGDGETSPEQSPQHEYLEPGQYDVSLTIQTTSGTLSETKNDLVAVLADSLKAPQIQASPGDTVLMFIEMVNTLPISQILVPIEYGGSLELAYASSSLDGCRTASNWTQAMVQFDPGGKRLCVRLNADGAENALVSGAGPVLCLGFVVSASATEGQSTTIMTDGYLTRTPTVTSDRGDYILRALPGVISNGTGCCAGIRGNIDGDPGETIDIGDLVHLVTYMFQGGPPPACDDEANINGSGELDIADLVYLVTYMFSGGPAPASCP